MKPVKLLGLACAVAAIALLVVGCSGPDEFVGGGGAEAQVLPDGGGAVGTEANGARKIVVFKQEVPGSERAAAVRAAGGQVLGDLKLVHGVVATLPDAAAQRLAARGDVLSIEVDHVRTLLAPPAAPPGRDKKTPPQPGPAQTLEWNIDRVDAEAAWGTYTGAGVKLAIIDTGVGPHPDLNVVGGYNATDPRKPNQWADIHGHGTHCAGIAAALNNDIGVVGVAPGVSLYSVRVMDRAKLIYDSYIIRGLQWCMDNGIQVASMSLGGDYPGTLGMACDAAANAGIILVAAAGNDGGAVDYPGAFDSVIAVSATNSSDGIASFSSRGSQVELAAPGVNVRSTCASTLDAGRDGYEVLSGTSMATPHVAGAACLALAASKTNVRAVLQQTADDLDAAGRDDLFGFGLVDAEEVSVGTQNGDN